MIKNQLKLITNSKMIKNALKFTKKKIAIFYVKIFGSELEIVIEVERIMSTFSARHPAMRNSLFS